MKWLLGRLKKSKKEAESGKSRQKVTVFPVHFYYFITYDMRVKRYFAPHLISTNYFTAKAAPVILKHSESADLLRKSLLPHVLRVPRSFTHLWASSCEFRPFDPDILHMKEEACRSRGSMIHFPYLILLLHKSCVPAVSPQVSENIFEKMEVRCLWGSFNGLNIE